MNLFYFTFIIWTFIIQIRAMPANGQTQTYCFTVKKSPIPLGCDDWWSTAQRDAASFFEKVSSSFPQPDTTCLSKTSFGCSFKIALKQEYGGVSCDLFYKQDEIRLNDGKQSTVQQKCEEFGASIKGLQ